MRISYEITKWDNHRLLHYVITQNYEAYRRIRNDATVASLLLAKKGEQRFLDILSGPLLR